MKRNFNSLLFLLFSFLSSNAQIEVAHLSSKGFSSTGFGGFFSFAVPVEEGAFATAEIGVHYFKNSDNSILLAPILLGYRYMIDGSETGWYVEPKAGYTIGASDIQKVDASGSLLYKDSGDPLYQKTGGITGAAAAGYIFPGKISFNIGLRYLHVFTGGDPAMNVFSFRISHTFSLRKRDDY